MNADNKRDNNPWVEKFNELVQTCQAEFKRTTQIGMKMVSASQSNAQLHEEYEKLGKMVVNALQSGQLQWENDEVRQILQNIQKLNEELNNYEKEVHNLKKD